MTCLTSRAQEFVVTLVIVLAPSMAAADPSKPIRTLIETPASALDFFLFSMLESSKCYQGMAVDDSRPPPDLCMTTIDYNFDDNVIEMHFVISQSHKGMRAFANADDAGKRSILEARMQDLVPRVGVGDIRFGLIQWTRLRYGWSTPALDEGTAKDEIARRTKLTLHANLGGMHYVVTRSHNGELSYKSEKSPVLPGE